MADCLEHLIVNFQFNQVAESVLEYVISSQCSTNQESARNISKLDLKDKDTAQAKSIARFLLRLSDAVPKEVMKAMVTLQTHLDSEVLRF